MECLNNVIGIRQACAGGALPAPRFGVYIEDFPGLTKTALQAIEPGVWLNCQAFLDDLVRQAWINIVEVDARAALEPFIRTKEDLEFGTVGEFDEEPTYAAGAATPRGLRVTKNAGIMGMLNVSRVWIQAETAGTFTLRVTDGTSPAEFPVVVPAGEPVMAWVHYETEKDRVDITINDVAFKPASGTTANTARYSNCEGCTGLYKFTTLSAQGLLTDAVDTPLQGIVAEAGITCSIAPAVCILAPRLKIPIFYATVIKALENWDGTARMNFFAQHKREWVTQQLGYLREFKYPQAWDLHAQGLAAFASNVDQVCINCGTGISAGHAHP